jgi:hypothetical protein
MVEMAEDKFDVVAEFGGIARGERFAVYIPNKDQAGNSVDQKPWVDEIVRLLSEIGGGATGMPRLPGHG